MSIPFTATEEERDEKQRAESVARVEEEEKEEPTAKSSPIGSSDEDPSTKEHTLKGVKKTK